MEAVHGIRHLVLAEGWGIRRAAREFGVSRNTVRRYLAGAEPGVRKPAERARPVFDGVRGRIDEILSDSARWTQGKQRLTATQLHRMLVCEGHAVGATLVKQYVAEWKRQRREVYVPLDYPPGDLAEVDFFEVYADVGGERRKAFLFVMRLMHSGRDFAWLYPRQDQVCFLDARARVRALRRRAASARVRQSEAGGVADPGGIGARADGAHAGARDALRLRALLRAARDGAR